MYCNHCGKLNDKDALYCKECGFKLLKEDQINQEQKHKDKTQKVKTKTKHKTIKVITNATKTEATILKNSKGPSLVQENLRFVTTFSSLLVITCPPDFFFTLSLNT